VRGVPRRAAGLNFNKYPTSQKELGTEFEALKAIKITAVK
jgi:hypothetical protein